MDNLNSKSINKLQSKFPHARFLMNDKQAMEITLKLIIQFIKVQNVVNAQSGDKRQLMKSLKFMIVDFLKVENFDEIDE
jgi:hypothetical protein